VEDSKQLQKFVTLLANDINDETPWEKKLTDGKQPLLWSYHFTALFWLVLLGLYTLAYKNKK